MAVIVNHRAIRLQACLDYGFIYLRSFNELSVILESYYNKQNDILNRLTLYSHFQTNPLSFEKINKIQ